MKNNKTKIGLCGLLAMFTFASCFDADFPGTEASAGSTSTDTQVYHGKPDTINYKKDITEEELDAAISKTTDMIMQLPAAQHALRGGKDGGTPGGHQYQFQYSLYTDNFAGYFCATQDFGGQLRSTYAYNPNFNTGPNGSYINVKNAIVPILNYPGIDSIPEMKATALLLYDYAAIDVADIYGPIPYQDYKVNRQSYPYTYNTVENIYKSTVSNIDTIVACYKHFETRPDWYKDKVLNLLNMTDYLSLNPSFDNWMRLANSLKLRMAIHIAKVEPALAKKWAEEAVASGVIETLDQQMAIRNEVSGTTSPLMEISGTWNDTRLNASFESMMMSYKHPFLENAFEKNTIDIAEKQFTDRQGNILPPTREPLKANSRILGLRSGIRMLSGQNTQVNFRCGYSGLSLDRKGIKYTPLYVMKLSEVLFMRAEGALRGWDMQGTAADFYKQGVMNAFPDGDFSKIYASFVSDYLELQEPYPYTYEDPYNYRYDLESVTKVGVKWNEGDDNELKLEKIVTQKYISIFPESHEAWVDIRRTGYPKIFPVVHNDGDGSIPVGGIIRRMIFPGKTDISVATDIEKSAIPALGGPDVQNTRLWWDVIGPNF